MIKVLNVRQPVPDPYNNLKVIKYIIDNLRINHSILEIWFFLVAT